MDVDILIAEIFTRAPLWDQKDKNHHNRYLLDKLWKEVAIKLNTKPTVVRNKWKSLRDKFRTTLASIPKPKSGDAKVNDYQGDWKYFSSLFFLKDQFTPRKSGGNFDEKVETILDESSTSLIPDEDDDDRENRQSISSLQENIGSLSVMNDSTPPSSRPSSAADKYRKAKRPAQENLGDALLQVEREKLQYLQNKRVKNDEDDEDLNFFKSLLPHVRTFSAFDKMEYRMKVMKITQDFLQPRQSIFSATRNIDSSNYTQSSFITDDTTTARSYYDNAERDLNILQPSEQNSFSNF